MNHYMEGIAVGVAAALAASFAGIRPDSAPLAPVAVAAASVVATPAPQQIDVRPQVSGRVAAIHFVEDQEVKKGDVLVNIDSRPYEVAVGKARQKLTAAQWRYEAAVSERTRAAYLKGPQKVSQEQLDLRIAAAEQASAVVQADQHALDQALADLANTTVRAPISGVVSRAAVKVGTLVASGTTTLAIVAPLPDTRLASY